MGVPGFFIWLIKNSDKNNKFIINNLDKICDYLLIDTNCLIHPVCNKIRLENLDLINTDNDLLEDKMIDAIILYINKLIDYVKPNLGIYIAIDGVPPVAKMKQQRHRRYKTIADNILFDNIRKKYNREIIPYWNTSAISPGTIFMDKLHKKIESHFLHYNKIFIYSSCYSPGEGEHKLLKFIKNNLDKINIIYGLDADLIFLALASQSTNLYLLRESKELNMNTINNFIYIDIEILKTNIYQIINITGNKINIINDFIFICYFLGNDFIPHIPTIDIYNGGIEYLVNTYKLTFNKLNQYLIDNKYINISFFKLFINYLYTNEENILKTQYMKIQKIFCNKSEPYDKELFKIDNLLFKFDDPVKLGSDNLLLGRQRYYKHYWNITNEELEDFSKELVKNYIIGLNWITLYYFDTCPSWHWFFPFDFSPLLYDINKYFDNDEITLNHVSPFSINEPLLPFMQLLIILPPQSQFLLPKKLGKLMTSIKTSIAYLYPTKFQQSFLYKKKYWMAIPILPQLDINLIIHIYNKYKYRINKDDLNRNKLILDH